MTLILSIFIDRSVLEVFANERSLLARTIYPTLENSKGISLFSESETVKTDNFKVWQMAASNAY